MNPGKSASPPNTAQVVEAFNDAFNRQNLTALAALITPDCVFENTYPPPDGEKHTGSEAVLATWTAFFRSSPRALFETEELVALGDRCVVRWLYRWTDSSGRAGHVRGIDLFRLKDGKIAEKRSYVKG